MLAFLDVALNRILQVEFLYTAVHGMWRDGKMFSYSWSRFHTTFGAFSSQLISCWYPPKSIKTKFTTQYVSLSIFKLAVQASCSRAKT